MEKENKWLIILALVLLAAALLITLLGVELQDRTEKEKRSDILERAAPLEQERDALVARRDRMQRDYYDAVRAPATEQMLFLELDPLLYEEAFPAMRERELSGVLGLSPQELPGKEGKITMAQFHEMLTAGWDLCLVCQESDFAAWDRDMTELLNREGIDKPTAVYFPENAFHVSMEEEVLQAGYTVVVHHGEDRLDVLSGELSDLLWLMGAHPWNYSGVKAEISELARRRGAHCFTVRFSPGREEYSTESFAKMLDYLDPFLKDGSLRVTGFQAARDLHDPDKNGEHAATEQWERVRAELNEQIRSLDEQIQAIYQEWSGGRND